MVRIKTLTVDITVKLKASIQSPLAMQRENCFRPNIQDNSLPRLTYHRPWR